MNPAQRHGGNEHVGGFRVVPSSNAVDIDSLVAFQKGFLRLELPAPLAAHRAGRVEMYRDPGGGAMPEVRVPQLPWVHAMRQQAINFVRALKGEIPPMCDSAEALEDLKVAREYIRLWKGR